MKIIHISDLHLGQILYQNYERSDEHDAFFDQLEELCQAKQPDLLLISGDVFDIQQPSAAVWRYFTDHFVRLHHLVPSMQTVIVAGNHDSPSRLHAHRKVWQEIGTRIVALPPQTDALGSPSGWEDDFIIELESGFIVAIPFMPSERPEILQHLLDCVALRNAGGKPVVMTGHLAATGCDLTGHDFDIGRLRTVSLQQLGEGYDYLALGHIHKPQTLGHEEDSFETTVSYPAPVARYSGSVLHVSCDEAYPHSVSEVDIAEHGGMVDITLHRIKQLRHFHTLPPSGESPFDNAEKALQSLDAFASGGGKGYVRFRLCREVVLPSDFSQKVYDIIERHGGEVRYNPRIDWVGSQPGREENADPSGFEVAELQQMTDPLQFIERTIDRYPGLDITDLRDAFREIADYLRQNGEK